MTARSERVEHEYAPGEKRCHALANVLDIHKIISTDSGPRSMASSLITNGSSYQRIVAFANILFQKQILTPRSWRARCRRSRLAGLATW